MKGINLEEQARKVSQLIAKYGADEGFKRKLLADPAATLKAEGVEVPAGLSTKALENTDIAPAKSAALSDEDLDLVAGGSIVGAALDVGCIVHGFTPRRSSTTRPQ